MSLIHEGLRWLHVGAGAIALITFWGQMLTRKGSPLHRREGRVYLYAMWVVVATAVPLSTFFIATGQWVVGVFFGYLVVITATSLWTGWQPLRRKSDPAGFMDGRYRSLAWANLASGATVLGLGLAYAVPLLAYFSPVGLLIGWRMLRAAKQPDGEPRWWLYEHVRGMLGSGIAVHVAFLNLGARRLIPGYDLGGWGFLAWLGPVVVGSVAIALIIRHYRGKSARPQARAA